MEHLHLARGRTNHLFRWRSIAARIISTVTMLATDESIDEHTPNDQARAVIMSNFARAADTGQVTGSFMDEDFGYTQTPSSTSRMASSSLGVSANRPIMKSSFVPSSHCCCCIAKKIVCVATKSKYACDNCIANGDVCTFSHRHCENAPRRLNVLQTCTTCRLKRRSCIRSRPGKPCDLCTKSRLDCEFGLSTQG